MTGNEVEIRVTAKNETKPGLEGAKRDTKSFSEDFDRLVTKSLKEGETGFQGVTRRATELRTELNQMRADFAKTGNAGLFGDIKQQEKDLKVLEDAIKMMAPRVEQEFAKMGDKAGKTGGEHAGDKFIEGLPFGIGKGAIGIGKAITTVLDKVTPQAVKDFVGLGEKAGKALGDGITSAADTAAQDVPALFTPEGAIGAGIIAALIGTLAPAAGAAVAAAITVGVGAGIIGIGAIIDKDSPAVVAGFTRLKDRIMSTMRFAADPLVEPLAKALDTIDKWQAKEGPALRGVFASVAPAVQILTDGFLRFLSTITPGLQKIGQTFTEVFQDPRARGAWDRLTSSVEQFFETVASNKKVIVDVFVGLDALLVGVLALLDGLINAASVLDTVFSALSSPLVDIYNHFQNIDTASKWVGAQQTGVSNLTPAVAALAVNYDDLAKSLKKTQQTADTLAGSLTDKVLSGLVNSDTVTLHWFESLTKLSDAFKQNGRQLDIHTAKGQANREAVLAAVQANIDEYNTMIEAGASAKGAASAYDLNTKALEKQLRQAGLTKGEINSLIGQYKGVPTKVNTTIAILGLTKAIEDLNTTIELINGLTKTVTIHVHTVYGPGPSKPSARATGGVAGGLTWVGERGAELVRLPQGSTVYSAAQSQGMAAKQQAAGGQAATMQMVFSGATNNGLAVLIQNMFRNGQIQLKAGDQTVKVG